MFNIKLRYKHTLYTVYVQCGPDRRTDYKVGILDINEAHREVDRLYESRKERNLSGIVVLENATGGYRIRTEVINPHDTGISQETKFDLEEFNRIFGSH